MLISSSLSSAFMQMQRSTASLLNKPLLAIFISVTSPFSIAIGASKLEKSKPETSRHKIFINTSLVTLPFPGYHSFPYSSMYLCKGMTSSPAYFSIVSRRFGEISQ